VKALNLVHVSSLPPTACGIAEYTSALARHITALATGSGTTLVRLSFDPKDTGTAAEHLAVDPSDATAFEAAAATINRLDHCVVLLQHEFKLYGGADGANLSRFLAALKVPVIATLHTVSPALPPARRMLLAELIRTSKFVFVLSNLTADILAEHYQVGPEKVKVLPHGVPDIPFCYPEETNYPGLPTRHIRFVTAGLLRPAKGIEHALEALREVKRVFPDFTYVICGADHPRSQPAPEYRKQLRNLIAAYGLQGNVTMIDRFVKAAELVTIIQACHAGILPYAAPAQSSSGVLAILLACGRPVIASDFQYSRAVLTEGTGVVVPAGDTGALASALTALATDPNRLRLMMTESYRQTRSWIWSKVAGQHLEAAAIAAAAHGAVARRQKPPRPPTSTQTAPQSSLAAV
jgi:glycosyltransferase involved in cell wall biosynthesis